jgi:hypothetical protein
MGGRSFELRHAVMDRQLYLVGSKNIPSRIVVDSAKRTVEILKELHDECGHKGRESPSEQQREYIQFEDDDGNIL